VPGGSAYLDVTTTNATLQYANFNVSAGDLVTITTNVFKNNAFTPGTVDFRIL
jgi:hypothetical protein